VVVVCLCCFLLCVSARRLLRCAFSFLHQSGVLVCPAVVTGILPAECVVVIILQSSGGLHCDWSLQSGTSLCAVDHCLVVLECWLSDSSSPFRLSLLFRLRIL